MELAFAGLQQLCGPMLERLDRLPGPQRDALASAFGLRPGDAPDRFLVGLAVLSLLSDVAEEQPLVCLVDDFDLTINDPATADHVGDAFRGYFGADRVTELTDPLPVSEDFGLFGQEWKVPSLFWYVGGTDPGVFHRAAQAGRIVQDVPTNHSSKFAPVLHPTLETGIQTLATASLRYLGH